MRTRVLPIILPPSTYRRLELEARAQEREPLQHARWVLRQHFGDPESLCSTAVLTTITREPEALAL